MKKQVYLQKKEWNTYCSILHIQVPFNKKYLFLAVSDKIFDIAESIYGRQGDNHLTNLDIGILIGKYEVIYFSTISMTEVITKAISNAEMFMGHGKYDSAVDRVHTAFQGYLRKVLENRGIRYEESDTLNQIYNKLHTDICSKIGNTSISDLLRTSMRSASGMITSINDLRNKYSLVHPNDELLKDREALLIIKLVKHLSEYINNTV